MGNLTLEDVNNMYLDVLKEIGNIGAGYSCLYSCLF